MVRLLLLNLDRYLRPSARPPGDLCRFETFSTMNNSDCGFAVPIMHATSCKMVHHVGDVLYINSRDDFVGSLLGKILGFDN